MPTAPAKAVTVNWISRNGFTPMSEPITSSHEQRGSCGALNDVRHQGEAADEEKR